MRERLAHHREWIPKKKISEQLSADRESKRRKSKRPHQSEEPSAEDAQEAQKCKPDARLEIYLARFVFKPYEMPDRRQIEDAFLETTYVKETSPRDQISAAEFTYEDYSEAFQYIVDIITNSALEL